MSVCFFVVLLLFLFCALRILSIDLKDYDKKAREQTTLSIPVLAVRGSIVDKNGVPITNSKMQTIAAINPTKQAITTIKGVLDGEEAERVLKLLNSGKPAVCKLKEPMECDGITCINVPVRVTENTVSHHLVGYLDSNGHGADGIEQAYDNLLSSRVDLSAEFQINGKGDVLLGAAPQFSGGTESLGNSVMLTLDINIQKKAEELSAGLKSGTVVIAECKTNKIRAMVSLPDFSPADVAASLNAENSPFINKALAAFNVGSAFKPCIAAMAIDTGLKDFTTDCKGYTEIENRRFNCHNLSGHGLQTLSDAIKNSCNCYFYELSDKMSSENMYKAAEYFSLGFKIKLAENLYSAAGNLPSPKSIESKSEKANYAIGQGDIMLSPVNMLCLYSAIANGGEYILPSVVEKTKINGEAFNYKTEKSTKPISKNTAEIIKKALIKVVEDGTGIAAGSEHFKSAGKTATAQTGRYDDTGKEITNSWFCGFFPADNPIYTVIVMSDGEYETSPAEVFKNISEYLIKETP